MSRITHYEGCWRDRRHHECAVREIERLAVAIEDRDDEIDELRLKLDEAIAEIERLNVLLQQAVSARWPPPQEWYEEARKALADH